MNTTSRLVSTLAFCLVLPATVAFAQSLTLTLDSVTPSVAPYNNAVQDFATVSGNSGSSGFSDVIIGFENVTITGQSGLALDYPSQVSLFCIELSQNLQLPG